MSKVLVTEEYLQDIADAIREKTGGSDTYTPAQMGDAIRNIPSGGEIMVASVIADGVKSYATLLSEISALIPSETHPKRLEIDGFTLYLGYHDGDTEHRYANTFSSGSGSLFFRAVRIKTGDTSNVYNQWQFGSSGGTDNSNVIPANGEVIALYEV